MKEKVQQNALKNQQHYRKMTEKPVEQLILSLCVPTIISMLITTIYNVADTFFVSKIGVQASGAVGILFSLMAILQAFGFMFGHGSGSWISRLLGAKQVEKAREYSSTAFTLAFVVGLFIMIVGLAFLPTLMRLLGSTETILPYAADYGFYILLAGPAFTTSCVMNNILRYEGLAKLAMVGLATGGILNMFLDPLFIFGLHMGITGAGLSTAISQYISMAILYAMFRSGKPQSRLMLKYVRLQPSLIRNIITNGFPSLTRQGFNSVSNLLLNVQAAPFGDPAIAAMSIVSKCMNLLFSICVGIGQGFQPVSSFNYGAKRYDRVKRGIQFTWIFSTLVLTILSFLAFIFAPEMIHLFRHDAFIVEIGTHALRYGCVALIFLPTASIANMTFQSTGNSGRATFLACAQNGLFFIPLIVLFPKLFGLTGIEIAQPIAYFLAAAVAVPILLSFMRKLSKIDTITDLAAENPK
ncbi:MATE family efflux transporter [Enterococcus columbae]|uniref:Multidrug export protein MepA n=1 Tax=Enterococcus columbae DSM 7374 = ATCC 51263 TaxID=1121865 RepID=S0KUE9_9ENTE|nr:MATE family efflux transporter [Enterococcus columbae]EOT44630.1 hypothetical protein OMW_00686 [Enterococcus columbae DSM 7374 = ATCC 51263]EOW87474.1 hypothetical protein I568_00518 [Enterococcus columbae DSM 7374 = ATCC 51263]OJG25131.1 hypothetical protein RR47_GL001919 [Enterococcus columbae DSM 7374 = ATCC 51263]